MRTPDFLGEMISVEKVVSVVAEKTRQDVMTNHVTVEVIQENVELVALVLLLLVVVVEEEEVVVEGGEVEVEKERGVAAERGPEVGVRKGMKKEREVGEAGPVIVKEVGQENVKEVAEADQEITGGQDLEKRNRKKAEAMLPKRTLTMFRSKRKSLTPAMSSTPMTRMAVFRAILKITKKRIPLRLQIFCDIKCLL